MPDDLGHLDEEVFKRIDDYKFKKLKATLELSEVVEETTGKCRPSLVNAIIDKLFR